MSRDSRSLFGAVFCLGFSSVTVQLVLMREMLGAFAGDEIYLGVVLGNWLLATGVGAWSGRWAERFRNPRRTYAAGQIAVAVVPIVQVLALRMGHDMVFTRGEVPNITATVLASFVVLLPYCLLTGFLLTLASAIAGANEKARGIGLVYTADCAGSIAGGALFTFLLVGVLDHFSILYVSAILNVGAILVMVAKSASRPRLLPVVIGAGTCGIVAVAVLINLDQLSTQRQYRYEEVEYRGNSPYGRLIVTRSGNQYNFIENGIPLFSTGNVDQVEETVHYAMAQAEEPRRVLLISGGITGTAKEILKYDVEEVVYAELDPSIIALGQRFAGAGLSDPRIRVVNEDGRLFVRRTPNRYDVVIVDVPEPSTIQLNRFYTSDFYGEVKRILTPTGVLAFPLGEYANYVSEEKARLLSSARKTLGMHFRHTLVIPGGRIFFLASDRPLTTDIAGKLDERDVKTMLITRSYLAAMLAPDRMADMERATHVAASANFDLRPTLYAYRLRQWAAQYSFRFGMLEGVLLLALILYVARLRSVTFVVFSAGFASSALEFVLLIGFQTLCGSVYYMVGVVVTIFMCGLALGAWRATCSNRTRGRADLIRLGLGFVLLAAVIPVGMAAIGNSAVAGSVVLVQSAFGFMTLLLGLLTGAIFPTAVRASYVGAAATASRIYVADFIGASVGALLTSTLLVPAIGPIGACGVTAVLCAGGVLAVWVSRQ